MISKHTLTLFSETVVNLWKKTLIKYETKILTEVRVLNKKSTNEKE